MISDRGLRGNTLNKTLDFWNAVVDNISGVDDTTILTTMWNIIRSARTEEKGGMVGKGFQTKPIFYAVLLAHQKWMNNNMTQLGLQYNSGNSRARNKKDKDILNKFFMRGEIVKVMHPVYRENRFWNERNERAERERARR
jgi:hypothetical protein